MNTGWKVLSMLYSSKIRGINRQAYEMGCFPFAFYRTAVPRALFTHIDGTTSSPHSYTGLIVSKLPECEKLPVVSFKPIKCDLPYYSADDLRKLGNYLR
ncbi:hypothetical protein AVEN_170538-1 [Araneus ventricosus]|uniref:Uncharacterized protein n=1 Tax=Araneus ventricosus TaxID=182803 RepID=A0A4Y2C0Z4_ARAVE|nr:hypothetical protein AVEN_170538-1 [Araneus ventricosus]